MKISFCTTCMDRLIHLQEAYLQSIKNTDSYENREFILLNYNSKDLLDEWVKEKLNIFIENKLVKYYKTNEPENFIASHAKNIACKLATGDLIVNLDADNILVDNYCENLIKLFKENNIIVASRSRDRNGTSGSCGMIICKKEHFYSVNGYDENIYIGWGMDDTNFQFRCRMKNDLKLVYLDNNYNYCIPHSNEMRTKNFLCKNIEMTNEIGKKITTISYLNKEFVANKGKHWGKATLLENFQKIINI
jgi:predicted glycosyltransferase involved in capsule biosynthesis